MSRHTIREALDLLGFLFVCALVILFLSLDNVR